MKYLILFLTGFVMFNCSNYDSKKPMMEKDFIGKTVQELLDSKKEKYIEYQFVQEPPGKLIGCQFVYSSELRIIVYAYELNHVEKFNIDGNWDLEKFIKETISKIEIIKP